jgi:hypothetical protein
MSRGFCNELLEARWVNRKTLLKELDRLPYKVAIRRAVALARQSAGSPKLGELMDSLVESCYEWLLRLAMAEAVGDTERILLGFAHSQLGVRRAAVGKACSLKSLDADRLLQEIELLDQNSRRLLFRKIRRKNRTDLAQPMLPVALERFGPSEAALLLPAAGAEAVREQLPELAHVIANWTTLTGRYPDIVSSYLMGRFATLAPTSKARLWRSSYGATGVLAQKRPEDMIRLASETAPSELFPNTFGRHWRLLARRFPSRVAEFLSLPEIRRVLPRQGLPEGVVRSFRSFGPDDQLRLAETQSDNPKVVARLLKALAPSHRGPIFKAAFQTRDTSQSLWTDEMMRVLPHSIREQEAKRMLTLRSVQEKPATRVETLGYLPPLEATEALLPETRAPQAEERSLALRSIVRSTAFYGCEMASTLDLLKRLKNEQDPVRSFVLTALSTVSGTLFQAEHFEALKLLVDAVVDARDSSPTAHRAISRILTQILRTHPVHGPGFEFAMAMLTRLGCQRFQLQAQELHQFEPTRCGAVIEGLIPLVKEAMKREDFRLLFCLAACETAQTMPEIQALLEKTTAAKPEWTARSAISFWLAAPETRDRRVEKLLSKDPSVITLWQVFHHVHRQRQDLLDPYLKNKAISGRFLKGNTIYLLPAQDGFARWLPRQQEAFAKQLLMVANDPKHALATRANAVARLGRLPDVDHRLVDGSVDSAEQSIREAALASLSGSPERLLEFLNRDEARVAAYALSAVIRRLPPHRHETLFVNALAGPLKVTAHKELVRTLGQCRGDHSISILQREWCKENLHRDVRIAVLHAVRQLLDCPPAWVILEQARELPGPEIGRALLTQSPQLLRTEHRRRYLELLLSYQNVDNMQLRQELWVHLPAWTDCGLELVATAAASCVSDLERSDWGRAADLLVGCCRDGEVSGVLLSAAKELFQKTSSDPEAESERDRPARQRLNALATQLLGLPDPSRKTLKSLMADMSALFRQPEVHFQLRLVAEEPAEPLAQECGNGYEAFRGLLGAFRNELNHASEEPLPVLERAEALAAHSHAKVRRLALECVLKAGPRLGWDEKSRELLVRLRKDTDDDLALAAARAFVVGER